MFLLISHSFRRKNEERGRPSLDRILKIHLLHLRRLLKMWHKFGVKPSTRVKQLALRMVLRLLTRLSNTWRIFWKVRERAKQECEESALQEDERAMSNDFRLNLCSPFLGVLLAWEFVQLVRDK